MYSVYYSWSTVCLKYMLQYYQVLYGETCVHASFNAHTLGHMRGQGQTVRLRRVLCVCVSVSLNTSALSRYRTSPADPCDSFGALISSVCVRVPRSMRRCADGAALTVLTALLPVSEDKLRSEGVSSQ